MRKFEKISFEQFLKDINSDKKTYDEYEIPKRQTSGSAGYDFATLRDYSINPGEIIKIPTGIKATMNTSEVLMIVVRSSMGFKHNLRLCNQIGIIDSDYYNNQENEGHISIALQNEGDHVVNLEKGQRFAQGLFMNYLTVDEEEKVNQVRTGSTGSTDKEGK